VRRRQRELLRAAVEGAGGAVVDCQGDELFAAFGSARAAVAAAAAAQRALTAEAWPDGVTVRTRMGLHTGEPQIGPDGYAGIDVVRAARLCAAAHGGQVLLSETTRLLSGARAIELGRVTLRDVGEQEPVHQLEVDGAPGAFPPLRAGGAESGGESAAQRRIDEAGRRLEAEIEDDVSRAIADAFRRRT
jgi:class 3 adenylate cyclase